MEVEINFWGVVGAAAASMLVGWFWYSKGVFGTEWAKMVKLSDKDMTKRAPVAMTLAFLLSLVTAYVLAHVSYLYYTFYEVGYMNAALSTAFWVWLGFEMSAIATHDVFEQRRKKLTALNIGNRLATLLAMALVIGWVGL